MKGALGSIVSTFKKLFNRKPTKKITDTAVHTSKKEKEAVYIPKGSNGSRTTFEANSDRQRLNRIKKRRAKNKMGNQSRLINRKMAA